MKSKIIIAFIISTILCIASPSILPGFKPNFYAPFIILSFFYFDFIKILWLGCISGLILDVFSSAYFGSHCLIFTLSITAIYNLRKYFKETPINVALFTILFSFYFTVISIIIFFIFGSPVKISFFWIITDLIGMSLFDGIFALIFFAYPFKIYNLLSKKIKLLGR